MINCTRKHQPLLLMGDNHPELDISPLLSNDDNALLFASYIGILQWAVELGQIDLMQSVLLMSSFKLHHAKLPWPWCCISLGMSRATSI